MFPQEFIGIPRIRWEFSRFFYKYYSFHLFASHNKANKKIIFFWLFLFSDGSTTYGSKYNYEKICISYLRIHDVCSTTTRTITGKLICTCSSCKYNMNIKKMQVFVRRWKFRNIYLWIYLWKELCSITTFDIFMKND